MGQLAAMVRTRICLCISKVADNRSLKKIFPRSAHTHEREFDSTINMLGV